MAKFESRYRSLSFYVDGERYEFRDGFFETDDPKVSFALSQLTDANRVGGSAEREQATEESRATKSKAASRRKATTPTKE